VLLCIHAVFYALNCLYIYASVYMLFTFMQNIAPSILKSFGSSVSECSAILAIMQRYVNDSEVQTWACAAIQVVASKSLENKQQLGNDGACRLVLTAMEVHSQSTENSNAEVIIWGCKALIALLIDSTSNRCILRSTNIAAIIEAARTTHLQIEPLARRA
jgi:hypothetical protein